MRKRTSFLMLSLPLAAMLCACGTTSSTASISATAGALLADSSSACVRVARARIAGVPPNRRDEELCGLWVDLRLLSTLDLDRLLGPRLRITGIPCLADGPRCDWQEDYQDVFRARLEEAFGNPDPQPNAPLPFDRISAEVQLDRTVAVRRGLLDAVADLDVQIESLRSAVQGTRGPD